MKRLGFNLCCGATPDKPINQLGDLNLDLAILGSSLDTETALKCVHKLKIIDSMIPVLTSCDSICLSEGSSTAPFDGIHYLKADADEDEIGDVCDETPGCGGCGEIACELEC